MDFVVILLAAGVSLACFVWVLAGYLGYLAGGRDFRKSRLPGNDAKANKTKSARKAPTEAQLSRLNLFQEESLSRDYNDLPFLFSFVHTVRLLKYNTCGTCEVNLLLVREIPYKTPHDGRLCVYCPNCFRASVFPNWVRRRRALGLPKLRGNFLDILDTLEGEAMTRDPAEPEKPSSFTATVEGTGGLRVPPMRVSVNPETQTVRPVEDEALAEAELADHQASEAAKRTLSN